MLADIFGPDLLIVAIVLVVVLFGGAAIPKLARNLGSAKNEFEKGLGEAKKDSAAAASATNSVACGPTAAAPINWPVAASAIHLTNPVISPVAMPLPSPAKRNLPVFTARFCFFASSSLKPAVPISGDVKITFGTIVSCLCSFVWTAFSAAAMPCAVA